MRPLDEHSQGTGKLNLPLKDQPENAAKIKELWAAGERNRYEIARQAGAHKDAVSRWIKVALEKGELSEEAPA